MNQMENESNKTAIDQMFDIIEGLVEYCPGNPLLQSLMEAKPRLKEVEKEQMWAYIKEKYCIGDSTLAFHELEFEQYYQQTYGGENGR
jgi:hypothetical protein